jgi:hypothetical protein
MRPPKKKGAKSFGLLFAALSPAELTRASRSAFVWWFLMSDYSSAYWALFSRLFAGLPARCL